MPIFMRDGLSEEFCVRAGMKRKMLYVTLQGDRTLGRGNSKVQMGHEDMWHCKKQGGWNAVSDRLVTRK